MFDTFNIHSNTIKATIGNLHRHGTEVTSEYSKPYIRFETQDYLFTLHHTNDTDRLTFWIARKSEEGKKTMFAGFERRGGYIGGLHVFSHYAVDDEDKADITEAFEQAKALFRKLSRRQA